MLQNGATDRAVGEVEVYRVYLCVLFREDFLCRYPLTPLFVRTYS
jgi:hypothetical protein